MRFAWIAASLSILTGCGAQAFQCQNDLDCVRGNRPAGTCEVVGYCSFPDSGCPSGQRYAEFSDAFGGMCVPADGSGMSGSSGATEGAESSDASSGIDTNGGSDSSMPATTLEPTTGVVTTGPDDTGSESTGGDASTGEVIDSDLVLWLDFESGDADKSPYNHAVSCESTCPSGTTGPFGSAALFDNDYLEIASHPVLDFSGDFTFTVWMRVDGMNALLRANIVAQEYAQGSTSFDLSVQDLDSDALFDLVVASEGMGVGITDEIAVGSWIFLAIRMEPGQREVFLDGELVSSGPITVPTSQEAPVYVGGLPVIGFPFEGAMDDLRIYRRLLTDDELAIVRDGEPLE
jgi:hypothetical protein